MSPQPAAAERNSVVLNPHRPSAWPASTGPTTTPKFMAARVTPKPSWRFSDGSRSAMIALLAVSKSGQPIRSRGTRRATCQSS